MKEKLLELLENSYSPYSKFKVAAIAVMKDGKEFVGVNVENASYGVCNCAERSAIFSAISNGYKRYDFEKITFPDYNSFSSEDLKTLFELSNALKNGNCNCTAIIKDITKVISRYCNISFDSIENMYLTTKNKRLEIN